MIAKGAIYALFISLFIVAAPANAALFQWTFKANIEQFLGDAVLLDQITAIGIDHNSYIEGVINFTTEAYDSTPSSDFASYHPAVTELDIDIGEFNLLLNQQSFYRNLDVQNSEEDFIRVNTSVNANFLEQLGFAVILPLFDSTGSVIDSRAIPTGGYDLSQFDQFDPTTGFTQTTGLFIFFSDGENFGRIEASLTDFTVTPVPLGSSVLFLVTALGALSSLRKRR